jgi:hypothetical protein
VVAAYRPTGGRQPTRLDSAAFRSLYMVDSRMPVAPVTSSICLEPVWPRFGHGSSYFRGRRHECGVKALRRQPAGIQVSRVRNLYVPRAHGHARIRSQRRGHGIKSRHLHNREQQLKDADPPICPDVGGCSWGQGLMVWVVREFVSIQRCRGPRPRRHSWRVGARRWTGSTPRD